MAFKLDSPNERLDLFEGLYQAQLDYEEPQEQLKKDQKSKQIFNGLLQLARSYKAFETEMTDNATDVEQNI